MMFASIDGDVGLMNFQFGGNKNENILSEKDVSWTKI